MCFSCKCLRQNAVNIRSTKYNASNGPWWSSLPFDFKFRFENAFKNILINSKLINEMTNQLTQQMKNKNASKSRNQFGFGCQF